MMRVVMIGLAALSLSACASGRRPPGGPGGGAETPGVVMSGDALLFVTFDADRDYRITRAEAEAGVAAEWARFGAAEISPVTFQRWSQDVLAGPAMGPYRLQFDANVDGRITAQEFTDTLIGRFETYDRDHDGVITRGDMVRTLQQPRLQQGGQLRPPGGRPPGERPGG